MARQPSEPAAPARLRSSAAPAMRLGLAVLILGLGGFGAWAALAEIASAVIAPGTIKVLTSRKTVQPLEGGIVQALEVGNGDRVTAGEVLIRLDDTRARTAFGVVQANADLIGAVVARLRAERDSLAAIAFPPDLTRRQEDPGVGEILEGQRQIFAARRAEIEGQVKISGERIGQLHEEIAGLEAQADSKSEQLELILEEHGDLKDLLEKGLTPRARVLALEREAASLRGERGEHLAGIARAKRLIAETELAIAQLQTAFDTEVRDELGLKEAELFGMAERLLAARHSLEQTEIRATEDGVVVDLQVHTVGGVVQPGETLMEIVPVEDSLVVEGRIRPADIDNVAVGLDAEIHFSAFSLYAVPKLTGQVSYVSADALNDEKTQTLYYLARIAVPEGEIAKLGDFGLLPGMPADIFIQTGTRTPLAYLIQPIRQSLSKAWRET